MSERKKGAPRRTNKQGWHRCRCTACGACHWDVVPYGTRVYVCGDGKARANAHCYRCFAAARGAAVADKYDDFRARKFGPEPLEAP